MMKKIILAVSLMFGGAIFVNAQEQQQDTTQTQTQTEQSDQYRQDTTSTDDSQNQTPTQNEQSDMYKTETDSTSTGTENSTSTESSTETEATTTTPTATEDQSATTTDQTGVTSEDQEQEGEKIEVSELPAAVSTKLQSTDYQGWVVVSARKKMWTDPSDSQATAKEVYVIEAKNGAETKKLKFDKDGNEIEHDKNKKDDQK